MIIVNPISPIAFEIFGLAIRWYALSYIVSFLIGYWVMGKISRGLLDKKSLDDLLSYVVIGVIAGGRLGYVLFYNLSYYMSHPLEIFAIWHGGMSFHGGLLGVMAAIFLFANRMDAWKRVQQTLWARFHAPLQILDMLAVVFPIGIFFGRIANFINMEIMGRATEQPWGVVFAGAADQTPRHASPLYAAALEGLLLFIIMFSLWRWTKLREHTGALSGVFAIGYGTVRIFGEMFRQPDEHIGFLTGWGLTMGMLLSALMLAAGAIIFITAITKEKK